MSPPFDVEARASHSPAASDTGEGLAPVTVGCASCSARSQCLPASLDREMQEHVDHRLISSRRKVPAGATLFRVGDRFESLYAIRTGFFKTLVYTREGRQHVTGFRMSGDLVGLDGISGGRFHVDAIALEDSHVCVIPFEPLQALACEDLRLLDCFHRLMSREIVQDEEAMVRLGATRAAQRVAGFLLNVAGRLNERGYSSSVLVLRMRRTEMASYLGLELETVCREFSRLQAAGLVQVAQREVRIIDGDGLRMVRDGGA